MPEISENERNWGEKYQWPLQGDEWSEPWGGAESQWYGSILPRIHSFVPTTTILEIAPGFGRWTKYLKDKCEKLILVDLNANCIERCKSRFFAESHIEYYVNDGMSLEMIPDNSIDFLFSFDSLVHVEANVIQSYLAQCSRKLRPNGVGFIHHSNIGAYQRWWSIKDTVIPSKLKRYLTRAGMLNYYHWRSFSVTAQVFERFCNLSGLQCLSQELINWRGKLLIDCFSVFTKKNSMWIRPNQIVKNKHFMTEAQNIMQLSKLYSYENEENHLVGPAYEVVSKTFRTEHHSV
jgi:ubiquinone/menaquinone biosynthesis C-methylase UbiE